MTQSFWLDGPLPGVNELIAAAKQSGRIGRKGSRWNAYNDLKERWNDVIAMVCAENNLTQVKRAWIVFVWHERQKRRDPDNVSGGGRKIILDGLKVAGILKDDSWKYVDGWEDRFVWGSETPGVMVEVHENAKVSSVTDGVTSCVCHTQSDPDAAGTTGRTKAAKRVDRRTKGAPRRIRPRKRR